MADKLTDLWNALRSVREEQLVTDSQLALATTYTQELLQEKSRLQSAVEQRQRSNKQQECLQTLRALVQTYDEYLEALSQQEPSQELQTVQEAAANTSKAIDLATAYVARAHGQVHAQLCRRCGHSLECVICK